MLSRRGTRGREQSWVINKEQPVRGRSGKRNGEAGVWARVGWNRCSSCNIETCPFIETMQVVRLALATTDLHLLFNKKLPELWNSHLLPSVIFRRAVCSGWGRKPRIQLQPPALCFMGKRVSLRSRGGVHFGLEITIAVPSSITLQMRGDSPQRA